MTAFVAELYFADLMKKAPPPPCSVVPEMPFTSHEPYSPTAASKGPQELESTR